MFGGVDLLHFYLCVHIAVIHKVHISYFYLWEEKASTTYSPINCVMTFWLNHLLYLWYAVGMSDNFDNVI